VLWTQVIPLMIMGFVVINLSAIRFRKQLA
jgi:hypothetical protein